MESPLTILYLQILGFIFAISVLVVDSQPPNQVTILESRSPPPPLSSSPPPPPSTPPRPPPSPSSLRPPPPSNHLSRPPPYPHPHPSRSGDRKKKTSPPSHPPPPKGNKLNTGKKIGLLFAGIAGILQIGVVGFLVYKRRQLLKVRDRYGTCI